MMFIGLDKHLSLPLRVLFLLLLLPLSSHAANYAQREEVQNFIVEMHDRHGFSSKQLQALFRKTRPLQPVLKAIKPTAMTSKRSWINYRNRFLSSKRITAGTAFWRKHQTSLHTAETLTGVPAEIITAIIGIESFYGKHLGRFNTFAALATLAFDYPPRAEFFRGELESLLLLARKEKKSPDSYLGSYAGAIGLGQFLPSSIRDYAIDFDQDGKINLVSNPKDAIGSVANFLKQHGWKPAAPISIQVKLLDSAPSDNKGVDSLIAEGIRPVRLPKEMTAFGVAIPASAPVAPAALIDLSSPDAAKQYWLGYENFFVITRYNRSSFYAMAVFQLAEELEARQQDKSKN